MYVPAHACNSLVASISTRCISVQSTTNHRQLQTQCPSGARNTAMRFFPLSPSHVARAQRVLSVVENRSSLGDRVREAFSSPVPALLSALDDAQLEGFVSHTLPHIARRAMSLPACFADNVLPVLDVEGEIALRRTTVASILSSMFLDLLPAAPADLEFNTFSMVPMLNLPPSSSVVAKIQCLIHYFERLAAVESRPSAGEFWKYPEGSLVYHRRRVTPPADFATSTAPLKPLHPHLDGGLEDQSAALITDFANRFIGGGVLRRGDVQEEIAFVQHPELIAGCALMPVMRADEAIIITGAEQFSQTSGYGQTLAWSAPAQDHTPRWRSTGVALAAPSAGALPAPSTDDSGPEVPSDRDVLLRCVVAIDATPYMRSHIDTTSTRLSRAEQILRKQLSREEIDRELTKAVAGFSCDGPECSRTHFPAVSSGRWGCGVFGGDDQLKSLLQWIAASISDRELHLYTFGSGDLAADLAWAVEAVGAKGGVTAGRLYAALLSFAAEYERNSGATEGAESAAGAASAHRIPIIRSVVARL